MLPTTELVTRLNDAGCPCGPIYDIGQAFEDEQVQHLKMAKPVSHPALGDYHLVRSPINMSAVLQDEQFQRPGPELGEHTDEVLSEMGLDKDEIKRFRDAGAI